MTKREKIIISAYTGLLLCDFDDINKYIEAKLGRPVYEHDYADKEFYEEIKRAVLNDLLEICKEDAK